MVTAGLTGGIASGKTTVARMFRSLGAEVIDADAIARRLVEPGSEGLELIKRSFGTGMLAPDGSLDRARLAECVFCDRVRLEKLNGLLHPLVAAQIRAGLDRLQAEGFGGAVIVDVPLLFECGWQDRFDRTIVVYCEPAVQRLRLMQRSGLDAAQADARIAAQMPLREKKRAADFVIDNQGTPQSLFPAVEAVHAQLLRIRNARKL